ncbi:MAG: polysaccharide deacetylase family protein [Solirubrobacterales bacterium]
MGNPSRVIGPQRDHGEREGVALTFDDGPDAEWTPRILAALDEADAIATFFVTPRLGMDVVTEIAAAGHEIGYHCGEHVRHTERERDEVAGEARADLETLAGAGIEVRCWRPPWGVLAGWTPELAADLGLAIRLWNVDTEDWAGHSASDMLSWISPAIGAGAVVLMHDGIGPGARRSDPAATAALVPGLVALIRGRGLEPVAVSPEPVRHDRILA